MGAQSILNDVEADSPLDILPVAGRIGAEIRGLTLGELDDATVAAVRAALHRHKVIFFRGQHHLDDAGHEALAERLGTPVAHPSAPVSAGSRFLVRLGEREGRAAAGWHTDMTFMPAYPQASILRVITAARAGGDTIWANTATAYEALPQPLRILADHLRAIHSNTTDYVGNLPNDAEDMRERRRQSPYETEHPVVRVHPDTGERTLVLGYFLQRFVDLSQAESQRLFEMLQARVTSPENTVRWRWQAGDVAIWDNRATQHRVVADFGTEPRQTRRATIVGDIPVGVDGRPSRAITPQPAALASTTM
jgi:taurine dioxygenase